MIVKGPAGPTKDSGLGPAGRGEPADILKQACVVTQIRSWL